MTGVSHSGGYSDGWAHVQQSIGVILTTALGTRVMRRDFGSELMELIDAPVSERVIMAVFAAVAIALQPRRVDGEWYGEPRFSLERVEVTTVGEHGITGLSLFGEYLPNGHKGDVTSAGGVTANLTL